MRIVAIMKYPPIQGGVSVRGFWMARALAERGHRVDVVTNAGEVEADHRIHLTAADLDWLTVDFPNGGAVRVTSSGRYENARAAIPVSNPYSTKLASLATERIRRHGADLVFSSYFEPYGLSGHLAATWTGLPHVVQHAGSDRIRLMDHPELGQAYREVLRNAALVIGDPDLAGFGVAPGRVSGFPPVFLPPRFSPDGPVADLDALVAGFGDSPYVRNRTPLPPGVPTLGVYGKVGVAKGSYDLLDALALVRRRGLRVNLLLVGGGRHRDDLLAAVDARGLTDVVWTVPFVPHWRVPEVLRACTAVCLLERDFPVETHRPGLPVEVLACGTCAVVSEDVARGQPHLPFRSVAHVVRDPRNVTELADALTAVIRDPERAVAMGRRGAELLPAIDPHAMGAGYEAVFERALQPAPEAPDDLAGLLRRHMPATVEVLGRHVPAPVGTGSSAAARAVAHAADTAAWIEETRPELPCPLDLLRDVVRFERNRLWLATEPDIAAVPAFGDAPIVLDREPRPVRSGWLRFDEFPANIESIVDALAHGRVPPERADPTVLLAFHKRGSLRGRVFRTSRRTQELLDLCDGTRTFDEVVSKAAAEHGTTVGTVRDQLRLLTGQQVVALRTG